ncbi:hypothetical protein G6711_07970 [Polynucleobacter paneuropaeus]|nr:hypothetical protein [Polynucleobacter paneuropaeus]
MLFQNYPIFDDGKKCRYRKLQNLCL